MHLAIEKLQLQNALLPSNTLMILYLLTSDFLCKLV